ncbi:MAG: RNA methyltransferase [Puniceicoccales bacterium]|jgi:TrmH family RNA methyltransferase|nr:RNA methyltransferase [Puniceicoccales bacterium]
MVEIITSRQNDRIKFLCKLRDRRKRDRYGMFLIEGVRELVRAVDGGVVIDEVFFCEEFFKKNAPVDLISRVRAKNIATCRIGKCAFEKISGRENCDGVIGLAKFWPTGLAESNLFSPSLLLVAEGIEKSGNLGAIMRSAESAGADALILCDPVTDIFNPNVVRASQGAVFSLPIFTASADETLAFLKKNSMRIFAATPSSGNIFFGEDFTGNSAIVVGSEHGGLSDFWLKNDAIWKISLPQMGTSDSLNVNDAAAIILYEVLRQRMQSGGK